MSTVWKTFSWREMNGGLIILRETLPNFSKTLQLPVGIGDIDSSCFDNLDVQLHTLICQSR